MKIIIAIFMFTSFLYGTERLSKLGFTEFEAEKIFKRIDSYEKEASEQLKKLKDKDPKVREKSIKFFLNLPSAPSELLVQALLKEKDKETRSNLKKIIMSAVDKPTFEDWTQLVLAGLTEHLSKNNGSIKHLVEIAHRNKSADLIPNLEAAVLKRSKEEDLIKIYKKSKDNIKLILFKAVSDSLSKEEINKALSSKLEGLRFKAAKQQLNKGNDKALKIILDFITSKTEYSKESLQLISSAENVDFDSGIKSLINQLGSDSFEDREKAKETLIALPSSLSKKIEKIGLEIYKKSEDPEIKISFLSIIQKKINDLMKKPGFIGVLLVDKAEDGINKVMISSTIKDMPAEKAEIPDNCQILKINEVSFENSDSETLIEHLKTLSAGTEIIITVKSAEGETIAKKLTLAATPNVSDREILKQWKLKNLETETSLKR